MWGPKNLYVEQAEKVAVERRHIDQSVRPIVNGIDVNQRSDRVSLTHNFFYRIDSADCVRSVSDRDQLCFFAQLRGEVAHIECAIFVVDLCPAHGDATFLSHRQV